MKARLLLFMPLIVAGLQVIVLLWPRAGVAMTTAIAAAVACLVARISRSLIRSMRNVHSRPQSTKGNL